MKILTVLRSLFEMSRHPLTVTDARDWKKP